MRWWNFQHQNSGNPAKLANFVEKNLLGICFLMCGFWGVELWCWDITRSICRQVRNQHFCRSRRFVIDVGHFWSFVRPVWTVEPVNPVGILRGQWLRIEARGSKAFQNLKLTTLMSTPDKHTSTVSLLFSLNLKQRYISTNQVHSC